MITKYYPVLSDFADQGTSEKIKLEIEGKQVGKPVHSFGLSEGIITIFNNINQANAFELILQENSVKVSRDEDKITAMLENISEKMPVNVAPEQIPVFQSTVRNIIRSLRGERLDLFDLINSRSDIKFPPNTSLN